ncbi:DUF4175 family protein [Neptunitalea chrysea]|uniref:DUF4175 family protein n=1 Tax=Neptunitalea chrysea TaxID=1647581 RepID=UPI00249356C4|nr:DUF4175 family protein [Neptunitalea chrysea]
MEHFLWLSTTARMILFWVFVVIEVSLFVRFIGIPLAYLFKLKNGLDNKSASRIIGNHFSNVSDKLINLVQLAENVTDSELLLASIEQKSVELNPIPFQLAINFKSNVKYAKYLLIPALVIVIIIAFGSITWFTDSYSRVVNYSRYYEPPAPFHFNVLNKNLKGEEGKAYTVYTKIVGNVLPESVIISYNNQEYFMKRTGSDTYQYEFTNLNDAIDFHLKSDQVSSRRYTLDVIKVPVVLKFKMFLDYPSYTGKKDEELKSTGNGVVPEGTRVSWKLETAATDKVVFATRDTTELFTKDDELFAYSKQLFNDLNYEISTNNKEVNAYESFKYKLNVIKDEYPTITLQYVKDSSVVSTYVVKGKVTDDYGVSSAQLVYYKSNNPNEIKKVNIPVNKSTSDEFLSVFPDSLQLETGFTYEFYYQVFDNDPIHGSKKSVSKVFRYNALTNAEIEDKILENQKNNIRDLDKSFKEFDKNDKELDELSKLQKERNQLSYSDKEKINDYLKKEQKQLDNMERLSDKLKENLENFKKENDLQDTTDKFLQERLERLQKKLEEERKLMEEMQKYMDKLSKEELAEKLEEVKKQKSKSSRDSKQMLELVKRYYVAQKSEMLGKDLEELSKEQEQLANEPTEKNTSEEQKNVNEKFNKISEELKDLQEENKKLQKPMDIPDETEKSEDVKQDQEEATEDLENSEESDNEQQKQEAQKSAKQKQKSAAKKMKQMSGGMKSALKMQGGQSMEEDVEMLRQILDNLIVVSNQQEDIEEQLSKYITTSGGFSKHLIEQQELKEMFEHVDDSLMVLASRQPMISVVINDEIEEIYFNMDKSLERLAENKVYQGLGSQQYSLTHINNLANLLSDALSNMQSAMKMQGSGSGQGNSSSPGMQLSDIIMSQQELNGKMSGQKSGEGESGEGEKSKQKGDKEGGNKEGDKGSKGQKGKDGKEGKNGQDGQGGEGGTNGAGGTGNGNSENNIEKIYEIYKQQQLLRQELEKQLSDKLSDAEYRSLQKIAKDAESVEEELLSRGITESVLNKMKQIEQQLIKLENASFEQGKKQERKSTTNTRDYGGNRDKIEALKEYFNQVEILNRQVLPLRQFYKEKVNQYFKTND